jgi:ribonuclease HII
MQVSLFPDVGWALGDVEEWCANLEERWVVGLDEAGRGPLAGPVYAAAVLLDLKALDQPWISWLNDSKQLTEAQRENAYEAIIENAPAYYIACRDHAAIDRDNILRASLSAMADALENINAPQIDHVLVDGNQRVATELRQSTFVKGDGRSLAIAAASILAKVARDREMAKHHEEWPEYGFLSNKGYGSKAHRDAIATFGPCRIHRCTFAGVKEHVHRLRE